MNDESRIGGIVILLFWVSIVAFTLGVIVATHIHGAQ